LETSCEFSLVIWYSDFGWMNKVRLLERRWSSAIIQWHSYWVDAYTDGVKSTCTSSVSKISSYTTMETHESGRCLGCWNLPNGMEWSMSPSQHITFKQMGGYEWFHDRFRCGGYRLLTIYIIIGCVPFGGQQPCNLKQGDIPMRWQWFSYIPQTTHNPRFRTWGRYGPSIPSYGLEVRSDDDDWH